MSFTNSVLSPGVRGTSEGVTTEGLMVGVLLGVDGVSVAEGGVLGERVSAMTVGMAAARVSPAAPMSATVVACEEGNLRGLPPAWRSGCGCGVRLTRDARRLLM